MLMPILLQMLPHILIIQVLLRVSIQSLLRILILVSDKTSLQCFITRVVDPTDQFKLFSNIDQDNVSSYFIFKYTSKYFMSSLVLEGASKLFLLATRYILHSLPLLHPSTTILDFLR